MYITTLRIQRHLRLLIFKLALEQYKYNTVIFIYPR